MADGDALHIFIVAGEVSGDRLGGPLMAALKSRTDGRIRFSGIGGPEMAAQGLSSLFPIEATAVMGFGAIPSRLFTYLRRIKQTANAIIAAKPDVLVIIDSPEFTHRIAKRVRRLDPSIPIVDYVSPSVWAWRPWRAPAMRRYIDHVLALLPFEPAAMERLKGPPCTYVGHPLSERVDLLRPSAVEQERRVNEPYVILLMPGSRRGELNRMLDLFERTSARMTAGDTNVEFVMPAVPAFADYLARTVATWRVPVRIVSEQSEKDTAFRNARAALVKSGTGTLELAVAGVPMVAAYRVGHIEGPWPSCSSRCHPSFSPTWCLAKTSFRSFSNITRRRKSSQPRCSKSSRKARCVSGKCKPSSVLMRSWRSAVPSRATALPTSCSASQRDHRADELFSP
jgi:lipid-A-disaccharide synthase